MNRELTAASAVFRIGAAVFLILAMVQMGCNRRTESPPAKPELPAESGPWIRAEPNPVPAGPGMGKATITWDTANGQWGEVYLSVPKAAEKLFCAGPKGSNDAPWIAKGGHYEFLLYAGKEHKTVLARVAVTKQ